MTVAGGAVFVWHRSLAAPRPRVCGQLTPSIRRKEEIKGVIRDVFLQRELVIWNLYLADFHTPAR